MKRVNFMLMIAATLLLLFSLAVYSAYAYNLITFPFDYDQGEGFELVDTILFSQFRWPYQNTDSYPFYSSNYPPLFHMMAAPFVWIFGAAYWYGRLLGFLSTLISAGAIYYAVYRAGRLRWIALLSALAFLASNTVYHIGPLLRQHMTMVMFETVAVVTLAGAFPQRQKRSIAIGLLLIIAAGYTKQLAAITALATMAWMILRNPRRGIVWSAAFTFAGFSIFAWMTWSTNGEWWRQAIVANVNQFNLFQTFGLSILWFHLHGFLIIPALLMVLYEIYFDRISLYSTWFIFAVILGAIGSGTWGAGDSYFATAIAGLCILSGQFFSRLLQQDWYRTDNYLKRLLIHPLQPYSLPLLRAAFIIIPMLYIGYSIATLKMPTQGFPFQQIATIFRIQPNVSDQFYDSASYNVLGYAHIGHFVTQADIDAGYQIVSRIQQTDAPVISEDAAFSIVAGREVITNPTQLLNLWRAGLFNGDELIAMIEQQTFGLIILRAQFYPIPILEEIGQHYTIEEVIKMNGFDYSILRPSRLN